MKGIYDRKEGGEIEVPERLEIVFGGVSISALFTQPGLMSLKDTLRAHAVWGTTLRDPRERALVIRHLQWLHRVASELGLSR